MPLLAFEGVVIETSDDVNVTFEGGKLHLLFSNFTGSLSVSPKPGEATSKRTPLALSDAADAETLWKRPRVELAEASRSAQLQASSVSGQVGQAIAAREVAECYPNGGLSQESEEEHEPKPPPTWDEVIGRGSSALESSPAASPLRAAPQELKAASEVRGSLCQNSMTSRSAEPSASLTNAPSGHPSK